MLYGHLVYGAQLGLGGLCRHWQCVWGSWCHGRGDLHLGCLHSNVLVHTRPHCTCNARCRDVILIHIPALCAIIFPWRQALRQTGGWKCKAGQELRPAGETAWWERRVVCHFSTTTAGHCSPFSILCSLCFEYVEESNILRGTFMSQCRQCGKRWKDLVCPGFLTQTKLKLAAELSILCLWTLTAAQGWRERNEGLREMRRRCRPKASQEKWALGEKRKWACLLWVSVQLWRGACARHKVNEGPASGECEDEHPVVTMMFGAINDAWCMEDRIDVIILQNRTQAKTKPSFLNENEREMTGEKQNICEMI